MARRQTSITSRKVRGIGRGVSAITLHGQVSDGPAGTIGRESEFVLFENDIAFVLSTLAQMPAYRHVFRAVADELDHREQISESPESAPVDRVANQINSVQTARWLNDTITDVINSPALAER